MAGCESRILHKKFDRALAALGVEEEEIDLVNLRDYVAWFTQLSFGWLY